MCPAVGYNTEGQEEPQLTNNVKSWEHCRDKCLERDDCKYWTWHHGPAGRWEFVCVTMKDVGSLVKNNEFVSGATSCDTKGKCFR